MVTVTNTLTDYDIREGKVLEWQGSRLRHGLCTVSFASGDYTSGGVTISGLFISKLNLGSIVTAYPVDKSDGLAATLIEYKADQKIHAYTLNVGTGASSNVVSLTEYASGQLALSGQSVIFDVIGT